MASILTTCEKSSKTEPRDRLRDIKADEIARDLKLMDELEALVQSLPDHRAAAGLGPSSLDAWTSTDGEDSGEMA